MLKCLKDSIMMTVVMHCGALLADRDLDRDGMAPRSMVRGVLPVDPVA